MVCCIYLLTNQDGYGYIGRTTNLQRRLNIHNSKYNKTKSKLLGEHIECIILEECDEDCLDDYERYYYDMYKEIYGYKIVNKERPLQTQKEYREANHETMSEYQKQYRKENREKTREYKKANREKIKEYNRKYNEANREKIKEYNEANREKKKEYNRKRYIELKQLKDKQNK